MVRHVPTIKAFFIQTHKDFLVYIASENYDFHPAFACNCIHTFLQFHFSRRKSQGSHKLYGMKFQDIFKDDFWLSMLAACERGTHMTTTTKIDQNHTDTILGGWRIIIPSIGPQITDIYQEGLSLPEIIIRSCLPIFQDTFPGQL